MRFVESVTNLTELKIRKGDPNISCFLLGLITPSDGGGGLFYWNSTSTLAADDINIVAVTNVATGRWIRITATSDGELVTGVQIFSGNGVMLQFNIPHGLGTTPSFWNVTPTTPEAAGYAYTNANSSNIIVYFDVAPIAGSNNLIFHWSAKL